jgi:hypothetical protein
VPLALLVLTDLDSEDRLTASTPGSKFLVAFSMGYFLCALNLPLACELVFVNWGYFLWGLHLPLFP